jgi:hypothetical protein
LLAAAVERDIDIRWGSHQKRFVPFEQVWGFSLTPAMFPAMPRADRLSLTLDQQRGVGCVGYVRRRIGTGQGMTQIPSVADGQRQGAAAGEEAGLAVGSPA